MFKFIHASDIHLDSSLRGLQQYEGAPFVRARQATRHALENLVELAINQQVQFLLIAGDLYDGDWKDYNTGLFFASEMSRLREADIQVFIIAGNHDAASQISKTLRMPDNVKILSDKRPESVRLDSIDVAIHGHGFRTREVTEDLSTAYPVGDPHLFNIGLLHTSMDGRPEHAAYAPCRVDGLLSRNYNYWALGHVHKREILHSDPWIVFSGNTQGRHVRETGAKGCSLVTVDQGKVVSIEHQDLDVIRWAVCDVFLDSGDTCDDALNKALSHLDGEFAACDGRPLAARLNLIGNCHAHLTFSTEPDQWINEFRSAATDRSSGDIWLEKIHLQTGPEIDLDKALKRDDAIGHLMRTIRDIGSTPEVIAAFAGELEELQRKLPPDFRAGEDGLDLNNPNLLAASLEDAKQLLFARLLAPESGK